MKKILITCALCLPLIQTAQAETSSKPLHFALSTGITYGGDNVSRVSYTDGSSSNISAGSGLLLSAGAHYRFNQSFSGLASVGYHAHFTPYASNGDASFSRIPLEFLGYYHINDQWRLGAGVRFDKNVRLNGSGAGAQYSRNFKDATGAIIEAEYMISPQWSVKTRLVKEDYETEFGKQKFNANHFGVIAGFYF